jgi:hypothetical protein
MKTPRTAAFDYVAFGRAVAGILKSRPANRRAVDSDDAAARDLGTFDRIDAAYDAANSLARITDRAAARQQTTDSTRSEMTGTGNNAGNGSERPR